jgi:hypothetical protein
MMPLTILDAAQRACMSLLRVGAVTLAVLVAGTGGALAQANADPRGTLEARVQALEGQLKAIQSGAGDVVPTTGIVGSQADPAGTITCPAGTYLAGVTAWKSSPATRYCVGCLTGVQIVCKSFTGSPPNKQ